MAEGSDGSDDENDGEHEEDFPEVEISELIDATTKMTIAPINIHGADAADDDDDE